MKDSKEIKAKAYFFILLYFILLFYFILFYFILFYFIFSQRRSNWTKQCGSALTTG